MEKILVRQLRTVVLKVPEKLSWKLSTVCERHYCALNLFLGILDWVADSL
jgi:hypothetical protein